MTAIGKRSINFFIGADITFYRPATDDTTTVYWSNRSWITNPADSVAPNRQYLGLLIQGLEFDYSWFNGDTMGGRSKRNYGALRAINPDGTHSLDPIFAGAYSVQGQTITFRIGEIGDDLGSMITYVVEGRGVRQSEDGTEVVIDLADAEQSLDSSIFTDRFQGLGFAVRHDPGEFSSIPHTAALNPTTSWVLDVAYSVAPGTVLADFVVMAFLPHSSGGSVYELRLLQTGKLAARARLSGGANVVLDTTDLDWVADGRVHRAVAKWDGTTLSAFHSTRTGGVRSANTTAQASTDPGSGSAFLIGDAYLTRITANKSIDIVDIRIAVDTVISDADIIARMKRPLTTAEIADYEAYVKCNENTGTTSADETGNGHTLTLGTGVTWTPTFEGKDEMAGKAKPLSFGYAGENAPITWADAGNGLGVVHSRGYKGAIAVFEGANRLTIGWPKTWFQSVRFTAATQTISFDALTGPGAVTRLGAQPGFAGLAATGQEIVIVGTASNNGTFVPNAISTERSIVVASGIVDEAPVDCYITAQNTGGVQSDAQLWFNQGGVLFKAVPTLPATAEILGDYGADLPTDSATTFFPEYPAAIMRTIIRDWGGETSFNANWDATPTNAVGAYWAHAGVWLDPGRDRKIRDVIDDGATTLWAAWGQRPDSGAWDLYVIEAPTGAADIDLGSLKILGLKRIKSIPPIGGLTLLAAVNYRPLEDDEIAGAADADDAETLRRENLEARAVPDATVLSAFPHAETPEAISTWLRELADARAEAQRRYDILSVEREMYHVEAWLYGLDQNPLAAIVTLTDADFGTLTAGKDFWMVRLNASDEAVTLTAWG